MTELRNGQEEEGKGGWRQEYRGGKERGRGKEREVTAVGGNQSTCIHTCYPPTILSIHCAGNGREEGKGKEE